MVDRSTREERSVHPWMTPIIETFGFQSEEIVSRIHSADEMFEQAVLEQGGDVDGGIAAYFSSGAQIARSVERLFSEGKVSRSVRALDFGCGFGRVTRFLCAVFGRQQVWASDLIEKAVQFQRDELHCSSFASASNPSEVVWPEQRFDLIYVGSLFTHLPESTFGLWLEVLYARLAEGGMLLFSVHDESLKPEHVMMPGSGLAFVSQSEARDIEHEVYGSAWITAGFLQRKVGALDGGTGVVWHRYPRALCGYQDLVSVIKMCRRGGAAARDSAGNEDVEGELPASRLVPESGRREMVVGGIGQIDTAELIGSKHAGAFTLRLGGWALPTGCTDSVVGVASLARVRMQLFSGIRRIVVEAVCDAERGDLSEVATAVASRNEMPGWALDLELPSRFSRGGDLVLVTAIWAGASGDVEHVLFTGSVDRLLLQVCDEQYRRRRDRVFELAETIEQVKASRFWQLRRTWFRIKKRLGWTVEDPEGPVLKRSDLRSG